VAGVLDQLEDVVVTAEPDDGAFELEPRQHLAHVPLDVGTLHQVGRREHLQAEHVPVPGHRGLDVGHAHAGVGCSDYRHLALPRDSACTVVNYCAPGRGASGRC